LWNPEGLSRPVMGLLYLFYDLCIQSTLDAIFTGLKFSEQFKRNEITQSAYIYGAQQKANYEDTH